MRSNRLWIGVACGVALGLGAGVAVDAATEPAGAEANFKVSPEQLKINQTIAQKAVERSNRSLNFLAPIRPRTTKSDNADDGSKGVLEVDGVDPGSGSGWTIGDLARGQKQLWASLGPTGAITAQSGPASGTGSFTSTRTGDGNYVVDFKTNVSACSWTATPFLPAPGGASTLAASTSGVAGQPTQVAVFLRPIAASPNGNDSNVGVQVLC